MILLTSEQMQAYDRQTIEELGVPGAELMENAGTAAVRELEASFGGLAPGPVAVIAGKGNNGGDGFVMALQLMARGWRVRTLALAERASISGDAAHHLERLLKAGGEVDFLCGAAVLQDRLAGLDDAVLVVDAILGTGLNSDVRQPAAAAIDWINAGSRPVVAVDVPSGIDASTGRVCGKAVTAHLTVSFAFAKLGLVVYPGAAHVGTLRVVDIGIPASLADGRARPLALEIAATARGLFPLRPSTGHKGTFGHLLVVAGSPGKTGAAILAAEASLRVGAGLTTLAAPASLQPLLASRTPEVMSEGIGDSPVLGAADYAALLALAHDRQALAIGPGLGTAAETVDLVCRLVAEVDRPLVVDADGLNALAGRRHVVRSARNRELVLTPHPGEMSRLTGLAVAEIEADRIGCARRFAEDNQVVLVLKGARTVTALPDGAVFVNSTGNPGMASGGMGDVLTGMIGGLLAQGATAAEAARLAVFWHGRAADDLAENLGTCGLLASEVSRRLPITRHTLLSDGDVLC